MSRPFGYNEMGERNQDGVDRHRYLTGPEAISAFVELAQNYLIRAEAEWDRPYGFPLGAVTAGLHVGVAATEWHIHAWDFTTIAPTRHEPANADQLFLAAGNAVAVAKGGFGGEVMQRLVPLGAKRLPWATMLRKAGR